MVGICRWSTEKEGVLVGISMNIQIKGVHNLQYAIFLQAMSLIRGTSSFVCLAYIDEVNYYVITGKPSCYTKLGCLTACVRLCPGCF